MPTCQNCNQKWSWKQTFEKSFTMYTDTGMNCPYCNKPQYITTGTSIKTSMFTFAALSVMTFGSLIFGFSFVIAAISISFIPLFVLLYPFWVELSNKENH